MKLFSKIAALSMSFLMLLTSMSYSIDMHYCGGELENISFFGEAQKCKKKQAKQENSSVSKDSHACCKKKKSETKKVKSCHQQNDVASSKECCKNKKVQYESNTEADQPIQQQVSKVQVAVAFVVASFNYNLDLIVSSEKEDHYHYKTPPLITDTRLAYQVFRI